MRDTKLILVEGIPGTGKSTLAQFIHRRLQDNYRPSYWCHEESEASPVRLYYSPKRYTSVSDYIADAESHWRDYARELQQQHQIAVLDAALLQNHLRSLLTSTPIVA